MTQMWTLTWVAGPDAGGTVALGRGTHIVGRAQGAAARCDDIALEPHHLLIDVSAEGASLRQLSGRLPVRVDGHPLVGWMTLSASARVEIGHSVLTVCPGDLTAAGQAVGLANITVTPAGSVVVRRPRAPAIWDPEPVKQPTHRPAGAESTGGLLPALLALVGCRCGCGAAASADVLDLRCVGRHRCVWHVGRTAGQSVQPSAAGRPRPARSCEDSRSRSMHNVSSTSPIIALTTRLQRRRGRRSRG